MKVLLVALTVLLPALMEAVSVSFVSAVPMERPLKVATPVTPVLWDVVTPSVPAAAAMLMEALCREMAAPLSFNCTVGEGVMLAPAAVLVGCVIYASEYDICVAPASTH